MLSRLFVAINLPENIKNKVQDYQDGQKIKFNAINSDSLESFSSGSLVKWVKPENLHLTLSFLGSIKERDLETVFSLTKQAAEKCLPFDFKLNKTIYAPPGEVLPRMIWAEVEKKQELEELKQKVDQTFQQSSSFFFSQEKEKFVPHITLARMKTTAWRRINPEERPGVEEVLDLSFPVSSIEVMESNLSKTGPEYQRLRSFPLGV